MDLAILLKDVQSLQESMQNLKRSLQENQVLLDQKNKECEELKQSNSELLKKNEDLKQKNEESEKVLLKTLQLRQENTKLRNDEASYFETFLGLENTFTNAVLKMSKNHHNLKESVKDQISKLTLLQQSTEREIGMWQSNTMRLLRMVNSQKEKNGDLKKQVKDKASRILELETELQKMERNTKEINAQYLKKMQSLSTEFKTKLMVMHDNANDTKLVNVLKRRVESLKDENKQELEKQQKKYEEIIINLRAELANSEEKIKSSSNSKKSVSFSTDVGKNDPKSRKKRKIE